MQEFKVQYRLQDHQPVLVDLDTELEVHLWSVTYVYRDEHVTHYTTTIHVLASDEVSAISQGSDNALGPFQPSAVESGAALEDGRLTAVATKVPFLIRGWGRSTF